MATDTIRIFVVLDSGLDRDALEASLLASPQVQLVGISDTLETVDVSHHPAADVLVIACAGYSERALLFVHSAAASNPERPVVVASYGASPNGFVRGVLEAGADDILVLPQDRDHVLFTLQKALVRRRGAASGGSGAPAPLIAVLGPKGGAGKTLTATNLSVALAVAGARPVLVDLDLQFGDVGLALGLRPERTLADLARAGGVIDAEKIKAFVMEHSSGLGVLLAPTRPDHAALVTVNFLRDLYSSLRTVADVVVVDTPPGFTPEVIATVDHATETVMVATMDALSLKNTKLGLETLELMGFPADRVTLVLNRADSRVGLHDDDVTSVLGREVDLRVPSDREVSRSVNEAVPIVLKDRSEAGQAFRELAARFLTARSSEETDGARSTSPRLLRLGFGRRG